MNTADVQSSAMSQPSNVKFFFAAWVANWMVITCCAMTLRTSTSILFPNHNQINKTRERQGKDFRRTCWTLPKIIFIDIKTKNIKISFNVGKFRKSHSYHRNCPHQHLQNQTMVKRKKIKLESERNGAPSYWHYKCYHAHAPEDARPLKNLPVKPKKE